MCRIKITDLDRAQECVQWMMKHIGPQLPGTVGTVVRGEGWRFWVSLATPELNCAVNIELTEDVDSETAMMFMLKWA